MSVSEAVVLRKELARSLGALGLAGAEAKELREELAARDAAIADRNIELAIKDMEIAQMGEELAARDAEIADLRAALEEAGVEIKDLKRREAYHDNANVPPSHRSLTLRELRREDVEERRRASTGRGPGREAGHEGVTAKLDPGCDREDRYARAERCPQCRGADLEDLKGFPKELVDFLIKKYEKRLVLHDLRCRDCGYVIEAPRDGTAKNTILGTRILSFIESVKRHCNASAGQAGAVLADMDIPLGRTALHNAGKAATLNQTDRYNGIVDKARIKGLPGEADEAKGRTAVRRDPEDDGSGSPPGTGKNRTRVEYKDGYYWAVQTPETYVAHYAASRAGAVLAENFPERLYAPTCHDQYAAYNQCKISQVDFVHVIRRARHAARTARRTDPERAARLDALVERLRGAFRRAKQHVHPGGALADPDIEKKAGAVEAEMAAIADAFEAAGDKGTAEYIRRGKGRYATFLLHPALSSTTVRVEQSMKRFKARTRALEKTGGPDGRFRESVVGTVDGTCAVLGLRVLDTLQEDNGVRPPREYAQIRAEEERRPRARALPSGMTIKRGGGFGRRSRGRRKAAAADPGPAKKAAADPGPAKKAARAAEPGPAKKAAAPGPAKKAARAAEPGPAKKDVREAAVDVEDDAPGADVMPILPQRRSRFAALPMREAAPARQAARRRPKTRSHHNTVHAAHSVAPDGPGPPRDGGPQISVAAA